MSESNSFLNSKTIGERIRFFRESRYFSLVEIGDKIGVSAQQFSKYETGKNNISIIKLLEVSRVLKVPLKHIIGDEFDKVIDEVKDSDINLAKLVNNYNKISSENLKRLLVHSSQIFIEENSVSS